MPDLMMLYSIACTILGVGFLILAHETGHFLVAKLSGVRVLVFSIGFGPAAISIKRGDTEYRLCWTFIGGYVRMAGDPMSDEVTGAPDELQSKSVPTRVAIFAGGPLASAVAGFLLFWTALQIGVQSTLPRVGRVPELTPAAKAGLLPGDLLLRLDGETIHRWEQFDIDIAIGGTRDRELVVERDGKEITLSLLPEPDPANRLVTRIGAAPAMGTKVISEVDNDQLKVPLHAGDVIMQVGDQPVEHSAAISNAVTVYTVAHPNTATVPVTYRAVGGDIVTAELPILYERVLGVAFEENSNRIKQVIPAAPAAILGLQIGDQILQINDRTIANRDDLYYYLHLANTDQFNITVQRKAATLPLTVTLTPTGAALPIATAPVPWVFRLGPSAALGTAALESRNVWRQIRLFFSKLFSSEAKEAGKNIGGPIGIFTITYQAAKEGWGDLMFFLAMISINLSIVNFLPVPLLDGGQALMVVLEGIKGAPLHQRSQDLAMYVGLLIILSLFIFATYNDLSMLTGFGHGH